MNTILPADAVRTVLLAPDSFKGSLSAIRFCEIVQEEFARLAPSVTVLSLPVADGGEGTLSCLHRARGGTLYSVPTIGPYGDPLTADVLFPDPETAVIEIASCVGLPLVRGREDPRRTSTFGIGRLIAFAADRGALHICLALGGSCTNDCGAGMLSALGLRFLDENGEDFVPVGATLSCVSHIEESPDFARFRSLRFTALCDVRNPLCGKEGCSRVFAPQKGADEASVSLLEQNAAAFARIAAAHLNADHSDAPGTGAAGGLGFAVLAFLGGEVRSGIDTVLTLSGFDSLCSRADLLITGEGCFDSQSIMGKVIGGLVRRSGKTPVAVLCGTCKSFDLSPYPNIVCVLPIGEGQPLSIAIENAEPNLRSAVRTLIGCLRSKV